MNDAVYTSADVCQLARIRRRQLDHWCRSGYLIYTSRRRSDRAIVAEGVASMRYFDLGEALKAVALARMLDDGITLQAAIYLLGRGRYAVLDERPLPETVEGGAS